MTGHGKAILGCLTLTLLFGLLTSIVHAAEVEPVGKFSRVPTGWTYFFDQTPDQLNAMLTKDAQRIVDVHVTQANPLLLTGAAVTNIGSPYGKRWWWAYGQTAEQVGAALTANHARLTNLKGYTVDGETRYFSVSVYNTGPDARAWSWFPETSLGALDGHLSSTGDRLIDASTWVDARGGRHYAAVTIANAGSDHIAIPAGARQFMDTTNYQAIEALKKATPQTRVVDLEQEDNGYVLAVLTYDAKVANTNVDKTAVAPDEWFYDGVTLNVTPFTERSLNHVLQATGARIVTAVADPSDSQSGATGYDLSLIQSQPLPAISRLPTPNNDADGAFDYLDQRIQTFMRQYSVTGAGLAIAIGGRLAYARAYGYADTELNGGTLASPNTNFRVGSISKFITMTALLKMIDEGALTPAHKPLTLDTLIFPDVIRPYLNFQTGDEASNTPPSSIELMTLRDLLHHASGWDEGNFPDPCGGNPLVQTTCIATQLGLSATPICEDIIAKWLIKKPLSNPPGTVGLYSNVGYCVAQAVVDALHAPGFADYMNSRFVNAIPLIDSVHHAIQLEPASDVYQPAPFAAHDYVFPFDNLVPSKLVNANPAQVDPPYGGIPLLPGLGAGGWKASPVGLLKLAVSINQSTPTGQSLSAGSFSSIFDKKGIFPASTGGWFGLGTEINLNTGSGDVYKTGAEPGGGGMVVYKNLTNVYANNSCAKCVTWVALINTEGLSGDPDTTSGVNFSMIDALNDPTVYNAVIGAKLDMFPAFGLPAAP